MFRPSFVVKLSEEHQRRLISDAYIQCYGAPPPEKWGKKHKHGGLVSQIRNKLKMSQGSDGTVRSVMLKTYDELVNLRLCSEDETIVLNYDINLSRSARDYTSTMKIQPGSKYEIIACMYIEDGMPFELVADLVSVEMINDGLDEGISKQAIYTLVNRLNPIRNVVKSKGQWTDNHEAWRIARYHFSLHLLVRTNEFYNHESVRKHLKKFGPTLPDWLDREKLEKNGFTFSVNQIGWFDEVHVYQKIGPASNIQCRFKWDSNRKPVRNESDEYSDLADMQGEKIIDLEMYSEIDNEKRNKNEIVNDDCDNVVCDNVVAIDANDDDCDNVDGIDANDDDFDNVVAIDANDDDDCVNDDEVDDECEGDEVETPESHDWHTTSNDEAMNHYCQEHFNIRFKFEQQARFMLGVTMVQNKNGTIDGKRLPMYTYSGKKIVGMGKYSEGHETSIEKAKKSNSVRTWVKKRANRPNGHEYYEKDPVSRIPKIGKGRQHALNRCGISTIYDCVNHPERMEYLTSGKELIKRAIKDGLVNKRINSGSCPDEISKIDHRKADNPYELKYGLNWRLKIDKTPTMKLVRPVSDMIHHMVTETSNALKGSEYEGKALFYHDALSQLTEKKTMEWMEKNEFEGRKISKMWIKPEMGCNAEIKLSNGKTTKDYAGRPPGNSPEFMPLGTTLNQDIHKAVNTQVAATYFLPKDHPLKFSLATPATIEHAYGRVHCPNYDKKNSAIPTSRQIKQDINKVFYALLTVMRAEGKVVQGLASRRGHRAYVNSLSEKAKTELVADKAEEAQLLQGLISDCDSTKTKRNRWLHPDTCEAQKIRWQNKKGKS